MARKGSAPKARDFRADSTYLAIARVTAVVALGELRVGPADLLRLLRLLRYAEKFEKQLTTKLDRGGALAARYTHGEGLRAKFFSTALQAASKYSVSVLRVSLSRWS